MERQLRARLGAARLALEGKEGEAHRLISETQVAALRALADRSPGLPELCEEGRAVLVDLASIANWHGNHLEDVLQLLAPKKKKEKEPRRAMQVFHPGIIAYFTDEEWTNVMKPGNVEEMKEVVFNRIIELSGRTLSENSIKFVASFIAFVTMGDAAMRWSTVAKQAFKEEIKKQFKQLIRKIPRPSHSIQHLAAVPDRLKGEQPALFQDAFGDNRPVPARLDIGKLLRFDNSYKCRGCAGAASLEILCAENASPGLQMSPLASSR